MDRSNVKKSMAVILAFSFLFADPVFAQGPDDAPKKRAAVPEALVEKAVVPGFTDIRTFADKASVVFQTDLISSIKEEPSGAFPVGADGSKEYAVLAISGGGANGAYGAGVINGWTKSGNRPNFKIITGISTGALIAPFVFLGPDYDDELKAMYTSVSTGDIMSKKTVINVNNTSSLADNLGLKKLVENNVTEEVLAAVAEEHKKGKRLYVATTNLDARRLVVWNMGKIAQAGGGKALKLFRDVLLASASIPIVFPPMLIDVEADKEAYQEIHVDGGTVTQVTAMAAVFNGLKEEAAKEGFERDAKQHNVAQFMKPSYRGNYLQLQFTVEDKGVFTTPWTATMTYRSGGSGAADWEEEACAENIQWYSGKDADVPRADTPDF